MKTNLLAHLAVAILLTTVTGLGQGSAPSVPPGQAKGAEASVDVTAPGSQRVVVRGWEIQSVSGIKKLKLKEVFPRYDQKQPGPKITSERDPLKGGFIIVQVRCKWATRQPPVEPLWTGKPDAVLVDGDGQEYPAAGVISRDASDYVSLNMDSPELKKAKERPGKTLSLMVYFDAPASKDFRIRIADSVPLLDVKQVVDLPLDDIVVP